MDATKDLKCIIELLKVIRVNMMRIVVIGATRGLGLKLTEKLLEYGYKVAAVATHISTELKKLQEVYNDQLLVFEADVTVKN